MGHEDCSSKVKAYQDLGGLEKITHRKFNVDYSKKGTALRKKTITKGYLRIGKLVPFKVCNIAILTPTMYV